MTVLAEIEWETCVLKPTRDPEQERFVRKAMGRISPMMTYYFGCPWIVRRLVAFDASQFPLAEVDVALARLIALVVSQDNSCRYCYAMSRAMLKLLGYPEERIRRLEQDLLTADVTPRVQRALEFVRRISQANPLPSAAEKQQVVAAGYSDVGVRELVFLAGVNIFYNRLSTLPALPTESAERLASSRLLTVFGPVIRRFMKRGNARPATLPDTRGMPFEYLVAAFGGSPLAAILAEGIREAWDSTALPRRAKGLAFAVVARGLSSPCAEREALRLLAEEGLDAREVGDILAHLASPRLDPIEAALVPFARETVSYRPAHIQRRTRTLHALLTPTQCLELVGIVALANAVCRMDVALDQ